MIDHRVLFESESGRIALTRLSPGGSIPPHHHSEVRDTFVVLAGTLRVDFGDPETSHILGPGDTLQVDPETPHRVSNHGKTPVEFALVQTNGAYDFVPAKSESVTV